MRAIALGAAAVLTLAAHGAAEAGGCNTIFKAGLGYVDGCTLEQRSPYADIPVRVVQAPPVVIVEHEIVYVTLPAQAARKPKIPVPYTYVAPPPSPSCGYLVNVLGRCPAPGDKWVYDESTGKVYPGTSVVPPYSDAPVQP
jgi:hypothetical protein